MRPEIQLQNIQCDDSSFFLDILWLPFVLYVCSAYPYQQNFLERHSGLQNIFSDPFFVQLRGYSSSAYLSQPLQSQLACEVQSLTSSSLLIYSRTTVSLRIRPKAQYIFGPVSPQLLLLLFFFFIIEPFDIIAFLSKKKNPLPFFYFLFYTRQKFYSSLI